MKRILHELKQGTNEWHKFRSEHHGSSEAAAMLGLSRYVTRGELLRKKFTGLVNDIDAATQALFDRGHETEELARPMAEGIIGDDLYPVTYSYGKLSASCDGMTMDGYTAFEHKLWNEPLAAAVRSGKIPDEYQPQCQQIMLVTGATRVLFMTSDGTEQHEEHVFVSPDEAWQKRIIAGWQQFDADLAVYQPPEVIPASVAAPIDDLPVLNVIIVGEVKETNLVTWKDSVLARIKAINTNLQTDNDFATAKKTVSFLDDGEKKLKLVKEQALAQTVSIDELFRTIDSLGAEMRSKRLELDKLVSAREKAIREEIVMSGKTALTEHVASLNKRLGKLYMPIVPADFAGVIKSKRTIASLRDAVDTELARVKIEANVIADRIQINMNVLTENSKHAFLFADAAQIVLKANDDFAILIKSRISEHEIAEQKRMDAERERIRAEEQARYESEHKIAAQHAQLEQATVAVAPKPAMKLTPQGIRPDDDSIIGLLSMHYRVHESKIIEWLLSMDLHAAAARCADRI